MGNMQDEITMLETYCKVVLTEIEVCEKQIEYKKEWLEMLKTDIQIKKDMQNTNTSFFNN